MEKDTNILDKNTSVIWDHVAEEYMTDILESDSQLSTEISTLFSEINITTQDTIAELGAGSGHLSGLLSAKGYQTTLLDYSSVSLEKAEAFYKEHGFKGKFILGDIFELNPDEKYDITWNSGVMEHFTDEELVVALNSIQKITKKYFIFLVPNPSSFPYLFFRTTLMAEGRWKYGKEYLRDNYEHFISKCGFKLIKKCYMAKEITKYMLEESLDDCRLKSLFLEYMDSDLLAEDSKYLVAYVCEAQRNTDEFIAIEKQKNIELITTEFDLRAILYGVKTKYKDAIKDLENLQKISEEMKQENSEQNKLIDEQNKMIENKTKTIEDQTRTIEDQTKTIEDQTKTIEDQTRAIEDQSLAILALNSDLSNSRILDSEADNLRKELNTIYNSKMWKLIYRYYMLKNRSRVVRGLNKIALKMMGLSQNKKNDARLVDENPVIYKEHDELASCDVDEVLVLENYNKYDVIIFSIIDFDFRHQRPQHFAEMFAMNGHRVFYINANFLTEKTIVEEIQPNLFVVKIGKIDHERIYDIDVNKNRSCYVEEINLLIKQFSIKDCNVIMQYPTWYLLADHLKRTFGFRYVLDYMDDFAGFNTTNEILKMTSLKALEESDHVVASSEFLYDKAQKHNLNTSLVRNAAEFKHFNSACTEFSKKERPIIGYYGAIAEWFDMQKIIYIAKARPNYDVVLIGDYSYADRAEALLIPNIKFLGEKKYTELPQYLVDFDVCLIPFKVDSDLIKATNPVKFYEYLCAGKKIVATEIPELFEYKDKYVYLTNDDNQFLEYIDLCVTNKDTLAKQTEIVQKGLENDWTSRYKTFNEICAKINPLVSIIVVTYNNLDYTKKCIDSILSKTAYSHYEIIVVDNKSSDDTATYLEDLARKYCFIRVILNDENYGFAKGNNIGINVAQGKYIILLNNDTIVTHGWITGMVKYYHTHDKVGLVGPVTNSIGNEAMIRVPYQDEQGIDSFAMSYTFQHLNSVYPRISVLAMFCMCISREVLDVVGNLDESYGIGMFEDDDYSLAVQRAGYNLVCAEDVFVHHFGSVSFKKLDNKKYRDTFEANKAIFENKWNVIWKPHKYREGVQ